VITNKFIIYVLVRAVSSEHNDGGVADSPARAPRSLVQVTALLRLLWRDAFWLGETGPEVRRCVDHGHFRCGLVSIATEGW